MNNIYFKIISKLKLNPKARTQTDIENENFLPIENVKKLGDLNSAKKLKAYLSQMNNRIFPGMSGNVSWNCLWTAMLNQLKAEYVPAQKTTIEILDDHGTANASNGAKKANLWAGIAHLFLDEDARMHFEIAKNGLPADLPEQIKLDYMNTVGSLGGAKEKAKERLFTMLMANKKNYINEFSERSFSYEDSRIEGVIHNHNKPLSSVHPENCEVKDATTLWQTFEKMLAERNAIEANFNKSGEYLVGVDTFDRKCGFAKKGGGSVIDTGLLYVALLWTNISIDFGMTSLPSHLGTALGSSNEVDNYQPEQDSSPQAIIPKIATKNRMKATKKRSHTLTSLSTDIESTMGDVKDALNILKTGMSTPMNTFQNSSMTPLTSSSTGEFAFERAKKRFRAWLQSD